MNFLVAAASLMGPIYFGLRDSPVVFVVVWAAIWNGLRGWATRKQIRAELRFVDVKAAPPWFPSLDSWLGRHLAILEFAAPFVTLVVFEVPHLGVYWLVRVLVGIS